MCAEGEKGTCRDVSITDNVFHTSGPAPLDAFLQSELRRLRDGPPAYLGQERPGTWTDGISVACAHSTVADNTIRDVSGVGIALRGAQGTQVYQNTVVARDRDMLVGIALVANPKVKAKAGELGGVVVRCVKRTGLGLCLSNSAELMPPSADDTERTAFTPPPP